MINNIQVLRFVAATMVLISHVQFHAVDRNFLDKTNFHPLLPLYWAGGVDVFFVISGFIMYHLSKDRFGVAGGSIDFISKRIIRIVPLYWIFTTVMLVVIAVFPQHVVHSNISLPQTIASYLFMPVANPCGQLYPVLIAGWTLNYEMLFYVIFALALMFRMPLGIGFAFLSLGLLGLSGVVFSIASAPFAFWCNPIIFEFLLGMVLAHLYSTGFRWRPAIGCLVFATGFAAMIVLKSAGIAENYWHMRPLWMGLPAVMICGGLVFIEQGSTVGWFKRALVFGGDSSYSLYLSHPFAIGLVSLIFIHAGLKNPWLYVVVSSIVSLCVAATSFVLLERPIGRFVASVRNGVKRDSSSRAW